MNFRNLLISIIFTLSFHQATAGVDSDLNKFYSDLNFESNATKSQTWKGQGAGYLTGGSMYLRTPVKSVQLISLQVPSLNGGCGGIDAYLGAFSFISGDQLQAFAKNIMSNAPGFAFDLALQTMVPELKQAKDFLEKLASDVNSANMSSCQAAQGIIGGLWPRTEQSQKLICQEIGSDQNIFSDWAKSRQECGAGGQMSKVNARANAAQKDEVISDKNLIWDALGKNHLFDGNNELKEFVMSLVGSIVFDAKGKVTILPPMINDRGVINVLMRGGSASIYVCGSRDKDKCLSPTVAKVNISENHSLVHMVMDNISSISEKVRNGEQGLTEKEKGFANTTSVPVINYILNSNKLGADNGGYMMLVADYIAKDILIQYLSELVQQAQASLLGSNYPEQAAEQLRNNITTALTMTQQLKTESSADVAAISSINGNLEFLQKQSSSISGSHYNVNANFTGK